jgi:hypothetical protein
VVPAEKAVQVPSVVPPAAIEQASQPPALHAALQQRLSAQKFEAHCEAVAHTAPFAWSGTQLVPLQ